jgi:hypothetical protein
MKWAAALSDVPDDGSAVLALALATLGVYEVLSLP